MSKGTSFFTYRGWHSKEVDFEAGGALSTPRIDFTGYATGIIHMPTTWTSASIGFKVSSTADSTVHALYDSTPTLAQIASPATGKAYQFPTAVTGAGYIQLWSQNTYGSDATQSARTVVVDLKG
ncbi:MAG: hypothetical protein ABIH46_07870 [Chloroflexota bacterium]